MSGAHERPTSAGAYVASIVVLVVLAVLTAIVTANLIGFGSGPSVERDTVLGYVIIDVPLLVGCWRLFVHVLRQRQSRRGRARANLLGRARGGGAGVSAARELRVADAELARWIE